MTPEQRKELYEIKQRLEKLKLTIAVAESLTCGLVQDRIGSVSGSSSVLAGGVTAYNIDQKVNLLGVDRKFAESCNCVAQGVADQMAMGVCKMFRAQVGIGTTGYAEPYMGVGYQTRQQPHAFFSIFYSPFDALVAVDEHNFCRGKFDARGFDPPLSRNEMRNMVADTVIGALYVFLNSSVFKAEEIARLRAKYKNVAGFAIF